MVSCGKANNPMKTICSVESPVVKGAYIRNYYFHVKCVQVDLMLFHVGLKKKYEYIFKAT